LIEVHVREAILDEAQKLRPNLYNERIAGDLVEIIRMKKPGSLIVAADTLIYFGDLEQLFDSIEEGLDDNGYVAFTVENVSTEDESM
jgi:predicted TPR repeat methyltransferase